MRRGEERRGEATDDGLDVRGLELEVDGEGAGGVGDGAPPPVVASQHRRRQPPVHIRVRPIRLPSNTRLPLPTFHLPIRTAASLTHLRRVPLAGNHGD